MFKVILVSILPFSAFLLALDVGASHFGISDLFGRDQAAWHVVTTIRLPRTVFSFLAGAALGSSGMALQAVFRNPLVSPYILGISSAGALGAACAITMGLGSGSTAAAAALLSLVCTALVLAASKRHASPVVPVLVGVALNLFFSAGLSLVKYLSTPHATREIVMWTMGSMSRATWHSVTSLAVVSVPSFLGFMLLARNLDIITLGEDNAKSVGVDPIRVRLLAIGYTCLCTAVVVAIAGIIGFVGLIIPHACRLLLGRISHHLLLPMALVLGGTFMVLADALSRIIVKPAELPIGIVTAMVGVPFFVLLLTRRRMV